MTFSKLFIGAAMAAGEVDTLRLKSGEIELQPLGLGLKSKFPPEQRSASIATLSFNIWNEGQGLKNSLERIERIGASILAAASKVDEKHRLVPRSEVEKKHPSIIVGLSEVRNLDENGNRALPGFHSQHKFVEKLVEWLNKVDRTPDTMSWQAGTHIKEADVGLLYRTKNSEDPVIQTCGLEWTRKSKTKLSHAIWGYNPIPLSPTFNRGSIGGWCLQILNRNYLFAVGHLDYKEYHVDSLRYRNRFTRRDRLQEVFTEMKTNNKFELENMGKVGRKILAETGKLRMKQLGELETTFMYLKGTQQIEDLVLLGDLNSAPDADWTGPQTTEEMQWCTESISNFRSNPRKCINARWKETKFIREKLGLVDAYRQKHTIGLAGYNTFRSNEGFTSVVRVAMSGAASSEKNWQDPTWYKGVSELDRLDYVFIPKKSGDAENGLNWSVESAEVFGGAYLVHKPQTGGEAQYVRAIRDADGRETYDIVDDIGADNRELTSREEDWMSDHQAILATFTVTTP